MPRTRRAAAIKVHLEPYLPIFPEVTMNDEIPTVEFLIAASKIARVFDYFGKALTPLKYDMEKNIERLTKKYNSNPKSHETLQKMLLIEKATEGSQLLIVESLLWIRRNLHFLQVLFEQLYRELRIGDESDDIFNCLINSYQFTMEHFHGWMSQQLFNLLIKMIPSRSHVLRSISKDFQLKYPDLLEGIDLFAKRLSQHVRNLEIFYRRENFE